VSSTASVRVSEFRNRVAGLTAYKPPTCGGFGVSLVSVADGVGARARCDACREAFLDAAMPVDLIEEAGPSSMMALFLGGWRG
jgi:hypothetical protein